MIKNSIYLEIKKDERVYQLHLPSDSPLGEVHDVLYQMRTFVIDKINDAVRQDQPKKLEEKSE